MVFSFAGLCYKFCLSGKIGKMGEFAKRQNQARHFYIHIKSSDEALDKNTFRFLSCLESLCHEAIKEYN